MNDRTSKNPLTFLYNHNPFYLLSTLAVLYSLHLWQSASGLSGNTPLTLGMILVGYIILLAATGIAVVKIGKVWEDARSIFLSILLIGFAIAVSLDHLWLQNTTLALAGCTAAFLTIAVITELSLLVLKIRFPSVYRGPYYLILAILFLYPIVFSPDLFQRQGMQNSWFVLGFSILGALGFLTLLPAIRAGRSSVQNNGTAWTWPAYPWSIFVVLFIAVALRCYTLCMSFLPQYGTQSGFSFLYLAPLVYASFILMLQASLVSKASEWQWLVLFLAIPATCLLTFPLDTGHYGLEFSRLFTKSICGPWFAGLVALNLFYLHAWSHGATGGRGFLQVGLAALAFAPLESQTVFNFGLTHYWPVLGIVATQAAIAMQNKSTLRLATACTALSVAAAMVADQSFSSHEFTIACAVGTFLFGTLIASIVFQDRMALMLRLGFAIGIPSILCGILFACLVGGVSPDHSLIGSGALTLLCLIVYELTKTRVYLPAALACLTMTSILSLNGYVNQITEIPPATRAGFLLAAFCLATGFLISLSKAGWLTPMFRSVKDCWDESIRAIHQAGSGTLETVDSETA